MLLHWYKFKTHCHFMLFGRRVCGHVSQVVSHTGSGSATGVDAAVVTITSGQPDCPEFVSMNRKQLELTGIL